ncbi:MAG: iron ABC transporter permease [Blastochloris sp.]|nr:iron ABC transporter permease [Blastochloris sp.]
MNRRTYVLLASGGPLIVLLIVLHLGVGSVNLTPGEVLRAVLDQADQPLHRQIVWELRLPRALIAVAAGALLGLSGALLQAIMRNPLAEPGLTGVSAGGVLFAVLWLTQGDTMADPGRTLPFVALAGGMAASGLVVLMARNRSGNTDPVRLVLAGILVSAILSSATTLVLVRNNQALGSILTWMIGSLNGRVWIHWNVLWPWAAFALPVGLLCAGVANALQLGDPIAAGIGVPVERARLGLLAVAALLAASAVAVVGAVGFIGLIGPHLTRRLVGDDARCVFPGSVVITALLLVGADVAAQIITLNPPFTTTPYRAGLPVGAVTALLGAPFFLYLLRRSSS